MFRFNDRVVPAAGHRIDQQQPVRPQTEAREGGEESQIDLSYLVFTGDEFVRSLAGNRCQTLRREDHVHSDRGYRHYGYHDTQKRPTYDFECAFHCFSTILVK